MRTSVIVALGFSAFFSRSLHAIAQDQPASTTAAPMPTPLSFQSDDGKFFDGVIEQPPAANANGYAVVLIGGGTASDRDWTVPAEYTTTGAPTKDAADLNRRLIAAGYVVMRWDAIMRDDPIRAKDPNLVTPFPYPDTAKHAILAFEEFKKRKLVADDHIFIVGHSLGARRACHILEHCKSLAGIVMLAGAGLVQMDQDPSDLRMLSGGLLGQMDWSGDNLVTADEFDRWKESGAESPLTSLPFSQIDFDNNGALERWELSARLALNDRATLFESASPKPDRKGMHYPEDILHRTPVPVLAIYGTLDNLVIHGVLLKERLGAAGHKGIDLQIYPDLGHCLGQEVKGKTGPIAPVVVDQVVTWLDSQRARRASPPVKAN